MDAPGPFRTDVFHKPLHATPAVVFEIEFVEQTPIADPLLQAQEACDEGEGLRECSGMH